MTILYKMISKKLKMKNGKPYWFAHAVHPNTIHLAGLATEMQRNCTVKVSDIHGVLTELVETMNDELKNGNTVKLDGLGSFRLSFHASQVAKPGDFSAAKSIKGFHVVFRPIHKKNGKKMYTPILQGTGIAELQKYVVEKKDQSGDTPKDGGTTTQP